MQLFEFIHINRVSKKIFAANLGVSYPTFLAIFHGRRQPKLEIAKKITELTDGKVSFDDFLKSENRSEEVKQFSKS